jgi:hypothetical protein
MNKEELTKLLEEVSAPISKIEAKIGMPKNSLQKALKGERKLPKSWALKLKDFIAKKQYIGLTRGRPKEVSKTTEKPKEVNSKTSEKDENAPLSEWELIRRKKLGIK